MPSPLAPWRPSVRSGARRRNPPRALFRYLKDHAATGGGGGRGGASQQGSIANGLKAADERLEAAIQMSEMRQMRALAQQFGGFFRTGEIGGWRKLLPPDVIAEIVEVGSGWAFARTNSAGTTTDHATARKSSEGNQELFIFR